MRFVVNVAQKGCVWSRVCVCVCQFQSSGSEQNISRNHMGEVITKEASRTFMHVFNIGVGTGSASGVEDVCVCLLLRSRSSVFGCYNSNDLFHQHSPTCLIPNTARMPDVALVPGDAVLRGFSQKFGLDGRSN